MVPVFDCLMVAEHLDDIHIYEVEALVEQGQVDFRAVSPETRAPELLGLPGAGCCLGSTT